MDQNNSSWSVDKINAMIDATSKFLRHLQATCASVGGQPSRINKISNLRFATGTRERNLYDFAGDIVFCTKYDKTTWRSGLDKLIPHVYPARVSDLLRRYLVYIRPLEFQLGTKCAIADNNNLSISQYKLFSYFGKSLDTSDFRGFIVAFTTSNLGLQQGLRPQEFRHAMIHICRRHILTQKKLKRRQQVADLQAGHTPATAARVYAIPAKLCPTDPRYFLEFRDVCYIHHEFFGLRTLNDRKLSPYTFRAMYLSNLLFSGA
jgi:hypothetical protein